MDAQRHFPWLAPLPLTFQRSSVIYSKENMWSFLYFLIPLQRTITQQCNSAGPQLPGVPPQTDQTSSKDSVTPATLGLQRNPGGNLSVRENTAFWTLLLSWASTERFRTAEFCPMSTSLLFFIQFLNIHISTNFTKEAFYLGLVGGNSTSTLKPLARLQKSLFPIVLSTDNIQTAAKPGTTCCTVFQTGTGRAPCLPVGNSTSNKSLELSV